MFIKKHTSKINSTSQVKNLSILIKIEGILNLIVTLTLLYGMVNLILGTYNVLKKFNYGDDDKINLIILIIMSIAAAIASIIYIIVSIKNFKSFLINVSSNPLNIIHKYEECTEGKIIKRIILIIIGTLILGRYMAINILPFIFTMINRHYVLDNAKIFNKVRKNLLKNQNTEKV